MAEHNFETITEELRKQLDSSRQNWLFGAGISVESNIPLMYPLTNRVKKIIETNKEDPNCEKNTEIYTLLTKELEEKAHIEHYLSHLGDLIALADRSKSKSVRIENKSFTEEELLNIYRSIIVAIGEIVRYGYSNNGEEERIGTLYNPIVEIEHHIKFAEAIISNRFNLLSRSTLTFFTTNYDTLLEDALGLKRITVVDGFSGGAIAYWNPQGEFEDTHKLPNRCLLYKLHGSIDWQRDSKKGLVRTRYGTKYLTQKSDIMIYPQATKYVETQKDPFSFLFNGFRKALNSTDDNVLITCGYSFGDEHINAEIEAALSSRDNRTTLVVFAQENPEGETIINKTLDGWVKNEQFGSRVYVAGQKGIYNNSIEALKPTNDKDLSWWTFSGLTNFILTGEYE